MRIQDKDEDALRDDGDAALRAIDTVPLYARADFVWANDGGSLRDWRGEELSTLNICRAVGPEEAEQLSTDPATG